MIVVTLYENISQSMGKTQKRQSHILKKAIIAGNENLFLKDKEKILKMQMKKLNLLTINQKIVKQ